MAKNRRNIEKALLWDETPDVEPVGIVPATRKRYLNYALSVITSRALPDVRDGLKPVQRRILYTAWQQRLTKDAKHRKCAKVVGDVMGNYHPHGDQSIYDTLVRLAQPFAMRVPAIEGSGNFGSIDGDSAAAMRYTECRLESIASAMLEDISHNTVYFRPNYDGTRTEPTVLPSKVPNLLINGCEGIAVGMATTIPPHNPAEICRALLKIMDTPDIKDYQLIANDAIQGPDFPTGGECIASKDDLREIYSVGKGGVKLRGTWHISDVKSRGSKTLIVDSIPYATNKSKLVSQIAQVVIERKMPHIIDVRDLSSEDIRIEIDIKKEADPDVVMAYLFKKTGLQSSINYNMTCLVPTSNPEVGAPERLGVLEILRHFLLFRHEVVTRRLDHELAILMKRLHILEGFEIIFDALDEIIAIIRQSAGKIDAAKQIMTRFKQLDAEQTDAILELKLYRLARLEVNLIQNELQEKRLRVDNINKLLNDDDGDYNAGRWGIVREEINGLLADYNDRGRGAGIGRRRTTMTSDIVDVTFDPTDLIVEEDTWAILSKDGWIKRQKSAPDLDKTKLREGDSVMACIAGSTASTALFFSNYGTCYTLRFVDIPASTGYGDPIQKLFKLKDGERIIHAISADKRLLKPADIKIEGESSPAQHLFVATSDGYAIRIGLEDFVEPSTKNGRRYAKPSKNSQVVAVQIIDGTETLLAASHHCHAIVCLAEEVNFLAKPGKGVILLKLQKDGDFLIGAKASKGERDLLRVITNRDAEKTISSVKYKTTKRGGKGNAIQQTGRLNHIVADPPESPSLN